MSTAAVDTVYMLTAIYFLIAVKHHVNPRSTGQGLTVLLLYIYYVKSPYKFWSALGHDTLPPIKSSRKVKIAQKFISVYMCIYMLKKPTFSQKSTLK